MNYSFIKQHVKLLSDHTTPVNIYHQVRDTFPEAFLLESSDYHGNENSYSYICFKKTSSFTYSENNIQISYPDGYETNKQIAKTSDALLELKAFSSSLCVQSDEQTDFIPSGLFGYISFDAVSCMEDIQLHHQQNQVPKIAYYSFQYIIAINHFNNEMYVVELLQKNQSSSISSILALLKKPIQNTYQFSIQGLENSNYTNEQFTEMLKKAQQHIFRGDVFQLVLSRKFSQAFQGDEFNVYRALRSVNPSPYLFYFDFGSFKIFGSSPEAQLKIKNNQAHVFPIAGTFKRSGNDLADAQMALQLQNDPKENAEHVMLVDLARNDLSKHSNNVKVKTFREIQYYSHVIHLVSEVTATITNDIHTLDVLSDTFPAGTLSGAPKYRALQLIDEFEAEARGVYGGCIGYMNGNDEFNHAIIIRSFLSKDNTLHYQAGAGIVASSIPENELEEVNNKIRALRKAIKLSTNL